MEKIEFKTVEELYKRVSPALYSKVKEIKRMGYTLVTEKDVWNYLAENEWNKRNDLELFDLISDILSVDNYRLYDYVMENIKKLKDNQKEELKGEFKDIIHEEEEK